MKDALAIHRWLLAHQVHHEIVRLPRAMTCADELPEVLPPRPRDCVEVTVFEVTTRIGREPVAVVASVAPPAAPGLLGGLLGARKVRPASAFTGQLRHRLRRRAWSARCCCPESLTVLVDERLSRRPAEPIVHTPTGERRTALPIRAPRPAHTRPRQDR